MLPAHGEPVARLSAIHVDTILSHLQILHSQSFVARRKDGLYAHHALADHRVLQLCELMCDSLNAALE